MDELMAYSMASFLGPSMDGSMVDHVSASWIDEPMASPMASPPNPDPIPETMGPFMDEPMIDTWSIMAGRPMNNAMDEAMNPSMACPTNLDNGSKGPRGLLLPGSPLGAEVISIVSVQFGE